MQPRTAHPDRNILREEWGFEGYVQSDFWSCRSCAASLNAGMDHEMPDAKWCSDDTVKAALRDTSLEIQTVNRALVRRFTQMFRFGHFEHPYNPGVIDARGHGAISRKIGEQLAVLLKNEGGLLPLDPRTAGKVLIVGQADYVDDACQGGGGSSKVTPLYTVPPVEGMQDVLRDLCSDATVSKVTVANDLSNLDAAKAAVKAADTVILMAGVVATEGVDRPSGDLFNGQNRMLDALLGLNDRTVVVLKDSSPVLMPWIDKAPAILEAWNQGTEDGHVVADLLFGIVNPGGKVPTTYPASEKDTLYYNDPVRYPGTDEGGGFPVIRYTEGRQVGYRWFQSQGIKPLFPFGFGLSYTTFEISDLAVQRTAAVQKMAAVSPTATYGAAQGAVAPIAPIRVEFTLTNTGSVVGAEVGQVYLGIPVEGQPPKRLVGFKKVSLEPGESQRVSIVIDPAATNHPLSVWDYCSRGFVVKPGDYRVYVGNSSDNTPLTATVSVG